MKKLTFKAFLKEDSDSFRNLTSYYEGKNLSIEDIHKLEEPSPSNFEAKYRVGNIYFDNVVVLGKQVESPSDLQMVVELSDDILFNGTAHAKRNPF